MTEKNNNSEQWIKFLGKIVITVAVGASLTTIPAIITGATTYLIADTIKDNAEDEEVKEVFSFISDCSKDVVLGGAIGGSVNCLIGNSSSSLASQSTKFLGKEASKEIAVNGVTTTSKTLIKTGKLISRAQQSKIVNEAIKEGSKALINKELRKGELKKHNDHIRNGIDYVKDCGICNE